ncbi:hypothetical protein [Ramlibacter sp. Leaf400]|uniref:hypothetical protein n=1 Tax=Ramlibacter sp. Leaf400 TaxID=1736365 RepID=UPI0006F72283|nr:hypothetical protein [Ramlibacter sp. Leaf400]KQT10962.1 hypothetical protein ASG30_09190 [Ramlibacter sp. Leaf400]
MSDPKIRLTAEDATKQAFESVKSGLTGIQAKAAAVTGALAALGVTAWATDMANGVIAVIDEWDELGKAAQRAGFQSAQAMAEYQFAAKLAGVEAAGFEAALSKLNGKMADSAGGNKEATALFKALGIQVKTATGELRASDAVLADLAEKFASWKDGPEKAALAADLFGDKIGRQLIPLLNGGRAGIEALREEFRRLNGEITDESVKAAETYNDNLTKLETAAGRLKREMAEGMLPGLVQVTDAMVKQAEKGNTLLAIWAGLAEFAKIGTNTDALGGKIVAQRNAGAELATAGGKLELLLQAQRNGGDSDALQAEIRKVRAELEQLQKKALDATAAVKGALNPSYDPAAGGTGDFARADRAAQRTAAPVVKKDTGGKSEFEALMGRIRERVQLQTAELQNGRQLSEQDKFEIKVKGELTAAEGAYTAAQRRAAEAELAKSRAKYTASIAQENQRAQNKAWAEEQQRQDDELAAFNVARDNERNRFQAQTSGETRALEDSGRMLELEARLIKASGTERAIAIEHLRIELDLRNKLRELDQNSMLTPEARDSQRSQLVGNAQTAKDQASMRIGLNESREFGETLRGDVRGALQRAFEDTKNPLKAFGDALASTVYTRLSGALTDAMLDGMGLPGGGGGGNYFTGLVSGAMGLFSGGGAVNLGSAGADLGLFYHGGGIAGGAPTFTRPVDSRIFAGAPRFHGGRMPGLAPGEVPAILEEDEGVFTPEQMKALGRGRGGGLTFAPSSQIVVQGGGDRGAILTDVQRALDARDQQWSEQLERLGVLGG